MFKLSPFTSSPTTRDDFVDFYDIFDDFFKAPFRSLRHDTFKIDVREEANMYLIEADMPGVKREDIKVAYDDQTLTISVERKEETEAKEDKERNYLHRERTLVSMKRGIHLPNVDPKKIKAKLDEGVLKIVAEKTDGQEVGHVIKVE